MAFFTFLLLLTSLQIEQCYDVFMSAFLAQNRTSEKELTEYFQKKMIPRFQRGHLISLAQVEDKIVGFALFEKWDETSYYLAEMAVLPAYQGKGIGKKLVFSIFEQDLKAKKVVLITEKANQWSQAFYRKIGFQSSSFRHPDYSDNFIGFEFACP